jgi:hypothetical protein
MALVVPQLNDIARKDPRLAEAIRAMVDAINRLAAHAGVKL